MSEDLGHSYDQDVLRAFDKMADDYEKLSPDAAAASGADGEPVTEEDIFGIKPAAEESVANPELPASGGEGIGAGPAQPELPGAEEVPAPDGEPAPEDAAAAKVMPGRSRRSGRHAKKGAADAAAAVNAAEHGDESLGRGTELKMGETASKDASSVRKQTETKRPEKKHKKEKKKGRHIFGRVLLILFALVLVASLAVAALLGRYVHNVIKNTPDINPSNIYDLLSENSVLYASDGSFMENIYQGESLRSNVEFKDIPKDLINAFVAIEDKTFWDHHGFNFVRIVGAIWNAIKSGSEISGTSTITQQLARNLYLPDTKSVYSYERKISEAYYALILEQSLTKEQIIEAYLNTIYLGFNSDGIAAAAKAYFDKDVSELDILECAELAVLPKNPRDYAPLKRVSADSVDDPDSLDIVSTDDGYITYYNNKGEARLALVLRLMHEQGKISDEQYEAAKADNIRNHIKPGNTILESSNTSYFADYVIEQVLEDLRDDLGYSDEDAKKLLYNGGLMINSTMDPVIQGILEEEYSNTDNFPSVGTYSKDKQGNILSSTGKVLLYSMENMFDENGDFVLKQGDFEWQANGDLKLFGGIHLNFYRTSVGDTIDYSVEFKPMFEKEDGFFYSRSGGYLSIPTEYKERDDNGDLTVSGEYMSKYPDAFVKRDDGSLTFSQQYFTVSDRVRQPQSAMVIMDHSNGKIHAMIGGRDIEGKKLFNRATSPRQPGSSIKPLAVYSVALQAGKNGLGNFTAATAIDDRPISQGGKAWPKNWYSGYRGMTNLRNAVEQSINACAVNLYLQLDPYMCIDNLQKMGVTSLVTSGDVNDINASALALGGMTNGISPLEMCGAYATFGNYGTYTEPVAYTTVTNKKGDIILNKIPHTTKVLDEDVASLMTDILRTTVTHGLASGAKLSNQPSAGKTGTTSDRYDIWFCGITPKYSAATWIGNDVNISLNKGSEAAVKVWKAVMDRVDELDETGTFEMRGEFVTATVDRYSGKLLGELSELDPRGNAALSEKFIKGTVPTEVDDSHVIVRVCADTGYLATPYCMNIVDKVAVIRPGGMSWEKIVAEYGFRGLNRDSEPDAKYDAPEYYCPIHNPDKAAYPISPVYDGTVIDNPALLNPTEPEEGNGYWTTDPETGLPIFIEYTDETDPTVPGTEPPADQTLVDDTQIPPGAPGYIPPDESEEDPNW